MRRFKSKYGARKITIDGERFDSKREAARYQELRLQEKLGAIRNLQRQVAFVLLDDYTRPDGVRIRGIKYLADFVYVAKGGNLIVEDCKGFRTDIYKLKKKMFEARYGTIIKET